MHAYNTAGFMAYTLHNFKQNVNIITPIINKPACPGQYDCIWGEGDLKLFQMQRFTYVHDQ